MKHIKFATVAVGALAAPMLALGIGSGTASAAPGVSFDNGSGPVGIGDNTPTGAQAKAAPGNTAVAVSIFGPSSATANGKGNTVVTFGSKAETGEQAVGNNVLATGGNTRPVRINGSHDNVVNVVGGTTTNPENDADGNGSHDNTIINIGGYANSQEQGKDAGVFSVSVCGSHFSGQGHVTVSKVAC